MEIRVLGCSGGIGGFANLTTSLLLDEDILIDCGTGVSSLSFEALLRIDHVFLTHSHLDHIALLPMLIDTVGEFRDKPLTVHASEETARILRAHIFNWLIWPDFTAIPDREHPFLRIQPMALGETVTLKGREITSLPASHAVPAVGYCLSANGRSLAFSGDTGPCDALVEALNRVPDLRYFIVETAFPDAQHDLALAARHLCPGMLRVLLAGLRGQTEVFVTHLKPGMGEQIERELQETWRAGPDGQRVAPTILQGGQRFTL